jgi:hypothetical protein
MFEIYDLKRHNLEFYIKQMNDRLAISVGHIDLIKINHFILQLSSLNEERVIHLKFYPIGVFRMEN